MPAGSDRVFSDLKVKPVMAAESLAHTSTLAPGTPWTTVTVAVPESAEALAARPVSPWAAVPTVSALVGAAVLVGAFVAHCRTSRSPLVGFSGRSRNPVRRVATAVYQMIQ